MTPFRRFLLTSLPLTMLLPVCASAQTETETTLPNIVITTDRAVTGVKAQLRKGSKLVAKATLAKLTSTGTLKFKLRKPLKPGRYVLALVATDGSRTVGLQAPLKVKR